MPVPKATGSRSDIFIWINKCICPYCMSLKWHGNHLKKPSTGCIRAVLGLFWVNLKPGWFNAAQLNGVSTWPVPNGIHKKTLKIIQRTELNFNSENSYISSFFFAQFCVMTIVTSQFGLRSLW